MQAFKKLKSENVIVERVKSFLSLYPPFDIMSSEDQRLFASKISISFYKKNSYVFQQNESPAEHFYLIRKGEISLLEHAVLIDKCDEGDILGIRALITQQPYLASAKCEEDTILYRISYAVFNTFLHQYPGLLRYFATGFAIGKVVFQNQDATIMESIVQGFKKLPTKNLLVTCSSGLSIKEAANKMTEENVGAMVIVTEEDKPVGIFTDKDLRTKVATGEISIDANVLEIASKPVICLPPKPSVDQVTLLFIREGIRHVCITKDGTPNSPLVSVISNQDILLSQGDNPASLVKTVRKARKVEELIPIRNTLDSLIQDYLEKDVSLNYLSNLVSTIDEIMLSKIIDFVLVEMELQGLGLPPSKFAWLGLGSQGRREQLLRTDQDNALIYEVGGDKEYFLDFARRVNKNLEALGFERCPADMMASNPKWCLTLEEWRRSFQSWIKTSSQEDLLNCTIFFDFQILQGYTFFAEELSTLIFQEAEKYPIFLSRLALNALSNPAPLSIFKNMVLEKSGVHKNRFDIKARSMVPLADLARLLCIYHKIENTNNTVDRFQKIALVEKDPDLFQEAAICYEFLMRLRTQTGIKDSNNGRYINPGALSKMDKNRLKSTFSTIHQLQDLIKVRFQTSLIS